MAHYAFLDKNSKVVEVIVGKDENEGIHDWSVYYGSKRGMKCIRTSYNTRGGIHYTDGVPSEDQSKALRFNYAGIGYTYDEVRDAFIPPKPFESWILNENTCLWEAPVEYPSDGEMYRWDEEAGDWILISQESE